MYTIANGSTKGFKKGLPPGRRVPPLEALGFRDRRLQERNRAMKLLKQFDPVPQFQFDDEGLKAKMRRKLMALRENVRISR